MLTLKTEKQLKNLGLNSYEVKLWVALLSRGTPTAGELSNISGVPKSRSYDVLKSLEEKGFVAAKAGKPIRYSASPPQEVVGKVKQRIQFNANDEIKNLVNLNSSRVANELVLLYERGAEILKSEYTTSSLQGKHNIYNHLESIIKYASKSILIFTTQNEFVELVSRLKPVFEKLKSKGVKARILTQINNSTRKYVNELKNFVEIRHSNDKSRFYIVDGKEMVFMVMDETQVHPSYDVAVWVNSPLAKEFEKKYFN